jgi:subtilisin family serine protease
VIAAAVEPAHAARLHPELAQQLRQSPPGALHGVIVELVPQVDPRAAAASAVTQHRYDRRVAVITALQTLASQTQGGVVGFLASRQASGETSRIRALWIVNAVAVRATERVIRALVAHPDVWEVRPDRPIPPPTPIPSSGVPLDTVGTWSIAKIGAPAAWGRGYTGEGVVVGSFDTGVDIGHPDLASRYRGNHSISWFDPYGEHATPHDHNGHGTHTTGTMVGGAAGGTAIGVAPDARWIAAKAWDDAGDSTTSAFHAIFEWFLAPGGDPANAPDVVNNSWAFVDPGCDNEFTPDIQAWRAAGIFPAFAAGNSGDEAGSARSPAAGAEAFAVGATKSDDTIAPFSGRGPSACDGLVKPDISAPGANVRSAHLDGTYKNLSGTSMATPHVAGAVAVLRSIDPSLTVDQLETLLAQSAVDLGAVGPDSTFGAGRLDLAAAVDALVGPLPPNLRVIAVSDPPAAVALGKTFQITDTTRNDNAAVADTITAYYLSLAAVKDASAVRLAKIRTIPDLAAGTFSTGTVTVTVPATMLPGGSYFVIACADDTGVVSEDSESDNCRASASTVLITGADLSVTALGAPPASVPRGGTFEVTDTVTNSGTASAAISVVRYFLSEDITKGSDTLLSGTRTVGVLAPLASSTGSAFVTVPSTAKLGAYFVLACADDTAKVPETSESNNCRATTTTVQVTGPDLVVTAASDPPATAARGTSFSVTDTVLNQAEASAGAFKVRYFLSKNTTKGSDTQLTGMRTVLSLLPQATSTGTTTVTVPATAQVGTYFVLVCADQPSAVAEEVETNNCMATAGTVAVVP